jgi:FMN phosphatase YigB (HAD superfamily)
VPKNRVHLDLWMTNHEAIAAKANEFMGFIFDEDGTLLTPEDQIPRMPEAEARQRAENDPTIHPLHYRVPLHLIRMNGRLVVDPNDPDTWAVLTLVRRGTLTAEHDQYEVK